MKIVLNYMLALVFLVASGCQKKKYPQPSSEETSIFYSRLMVNGEQLDLNTGEKGYYMFSSFSLDSSNVFNLVGEFKQSDCSNCSNSLRIQINDSKISLPGSSINIDSALRVKSYGFLSGNTDIGHSVNFTGAFNKSTSSVLWDFGDGTTSAELSPKHFFKPGKYEVTLKIEGPGMCQSTLVNTLSLNSPNDLNAFMVSSVISNTVSFIAHTSGGKAPYIYSWDFGDGISSTSTSTTASHSYGLAGGYGAKLKVTDADGKTTTCYYNVVAGGDMSACATNFSFLSTSITKRLGLSQTSIQYTDAVGRLFTSDNIAQPSSSSFDVLSVEEFVKNEKGQPVKKLKLKFNCTLYNGSQSVSLQGMDVIAGFAY